MKKKILIVEDDKFLANAYRVKLSKTGFDIRLAKDGVEALNILKSFRPNVIITDLVMPNMDGFELLAKIKADPNISTIPVVVSSSLGQKEDLDRVWKLGAVDYLIKSELSMKEFVVKLNDLIAGKSVKTSRPVQKNDNELLQK